MIRKLVFTILAFTSSSYAREVELSWEPFENTLGYQVMIAKSPDFKKAVFKKAVKTPTVTVNLDVGTYFYRVRAVDKQKQPGHWSEPMKFQVTPYPPELKTPKSESEYSYYEILPTIDFEWKPVDENPEYEIFIYKTTGKKVFEGKTKDLKVSVNTIEEGEYMWKVRTIYKGIYESSYGEPRRFTVEKKSLANPELIAPAKDAQLPAYDGFNLEWKKDENTHYTDIALSYKDEETGEVRKLDPPQNLKDETSYYVDFAEPGEYKWRVRTKEGESKRGTDSEVNSFKVRKDLISDHNSAFYFGLGYMTKDYDFKTRKTTPAHDGNIQSGGFYNTAGGYYYLSSGFGLQLDTYFGDIEQKKWDLPESGYTLTTRFRMGTPGFNQQFLLGWRQMNEYEILTSPETYVLHTTGGFVVGTQMNGSVARRVRLKIDFLYYKPLSVLEPNGKFESDIYEGTLGFSYHLTYKFWISLEGQYQLGIFKSIKKDASDNEDTRWTSTRITPIMLKFSFEN